MFQGHYGSEDQSAVLILTECQRLLSLKAFLLLVIIAVLII